MILVFYKMHQNQFREKDLKNLKNEIGCKVHNATQLTFNWSAAINGRFERKLQTFINRLPFVYFSVSVIIHNDKKNNSGKSLNAAMQFAQGNCNAKNIKHVILNDKALHGLKLS